MTRELKCIADEFVMRKCAVKCALSWVQVISPNFRALVLKKKNIFYKTENVLAVLAV